MGNSKSKRIDKAKTFVLSRVNVVSTATTTTTSFVSQSSDTIDTATPPKPLPLPAGVTIVWLDAKANSNSNDHCTTKVMLDKVCPPVRTFDDVEICQDFFRTNKNRRARVFLVVSGKYSILILPNLEKLSVIDSVFIFCSQPEKYEHLADEYSSHVVGVFSEQEVLRSCLEIELKNYDIRAPVLNFFAQKKSATRNLTYDAASFLWFQLLQKMLMKTMYDANDMKQMLSYCREQCARHPRRQKFLGEIDEFERTYTSAIAINWYTRQSFVYKLVNTALRTEDIEALCIFRFYISDLCRQLAKEHKKFRIQNQKTSIIKLYRGCHMTLEELDKLQETNNGMVSINGFVSTSMLHMVADVFMSRESHRGPDTQKVLWILEVDCRIDDVIFASLVPFSDHPEEEEVLFNIGSAFRIGTVKLNETDNVYYVKATATNAGSRAVSDYMELIEHELDETSEKVIFGTLLIDMGKYVTAQHYFEDLIKHSDKNHPDLAAFHYNLGLTYSFQRDLHLAESNFRQALNYQKLSPTKKRSMVRTLNALGWVYQDNGELSMAKNFYNQAESICKEKLGSNDLANAQTYICMGRYYLQRQQYTESNTFYEAALTILRLYLPDQHQRFGIIFNEMGDLKRKQGDLQPALELYEKAEAMFRATLPEHHPCVAYCWSMMGFIFLQLKDIEAAQSYHKKALKSYKRVLPPNHNNISISAKNLKCMNYEHLMDSYLQVCSQV